MLKIFSACCIFEHVLLNRIEFGSSQLRLSWGKRWRDCVQSEVLLWHGRPCDCSFIVWCIYVSARSRIFSELLHFLHVGKPFSRGVEAKRVTVSIIDMRIWPSTCLVERWWARGTSLEGVSEITPACNLSRASVRSRLEALVKSLLSSFSLIGSILIQMKSWMINIFLRRVSKPP